MNRLAAEGTMRELPKVVATSVIRATQMGDTHGGMYLVDLEAGEFEKTIDWHKEDIDWRGRGGERGLRGLVVTILYGIFSIPPEYATEGREDSDPAVGKASAEPPSARRDGPGGCR
ncbi:unnamed protein product [marine sediment metagenome]|uniref:Uncharacterized protein n=1 Tax=marine sediment metagenome TaxID=412755 RepID=X0VTC7_9ZZZZ